MGSAEYREYNMDSFEGKVVAITGIAGIGFSIAKQLRNRGALLSLADIDQKALDESFALLGASEKHVMITKVDITSAAEVGDWLDATLAKFGKLDCAANMAGAIGKHHGIRKLVDQDDDEWDLIMKVNVNGMKNCLRAQLRRMSPGGSIVNASSIQGLLGFANHAAYSTSKHAVTGLTRVAAKEAAPDIRVNAIAPGVIATPLLDKAIAIHGNTETSSAIPRPGTADEAAQLAAFLLSDAASYITGSVNSVDGGWL